MTADILPDSLASQLHVLLGGKPGYLHALGDVVIAQRLSVDHLVDLFLAVRQEMDGFLDELFVLFLLDRMVGRVVIGPLVGLHFETMDHPGPPGVTIEIVENGIADEDEEIIAELTDGGEIGAPVPKPDKYLLDELFGFRLVLYVNHYSIVHLCAIQAIEPLECRSIPCGDGRK